MSVKEVSRFETREVSIHGHRVVYKTSGQGPVIILIHGITGEAGTWGPVAELMSGDHRLIAPDLLGHGESAKPRGDYSLGAHASGIRDLMAVLEVDRATIVGHSLGGGIAMQLAYQHPELCERLVLVSSGGLGHEVSPLLRAATLPGAELVMPLVCNERLRDVGAAVGRLMARFGLRPSADVSEVARGYSSLVGSEARTAFLATLRAAVDATGQRVNASDRLYLAASVPTLLVWGDRDPIIPAAHGHDAHAAIPGSRLEIFAGAGHMPHIEQPGRFAGLLAEFVATTRPAEVPIEQWASLMRGVA